RGNAPPHQRRAAPGPRRGDYTPEQICAVIAMTCEKPSESERPISHWSQREIADEAIRRGLVSNISQRSVGRFLNLHRATLWVLFRNKCIVALVAVVAVGMWATLFALSIMSTAIRLRQRVGDEI